MERLQEVDNIGPEPRLACVPRALEGKTPALHARAPGHVLAALQKLPLVGVVPGADALGEAVRAEHHGHVTALVGGELFETLPHQSRHHVAPLLVMVPALGERYAEPAVQPLLRFLYRLAVATQADPRAVRGERKGHGAVHSVCYHPVHYVA